MNNIRIDIREGTVNFWIEEHKVKFADSDFTPLFKANSPEGSVSIVKDEDNKLKLFHEYTGKGITSVEYDVAALDPNSRHMITATWSTENREVTLYVDAKKVAVGKMNYE